MNKELTRQEMIEFLTRPTDPNDEFSEYPEPEPPTYEEMLASLTNEELLAHYNQTIISEFEETANTPKVKKAANTRVMSAAETRKVNSVLRILSAVIHQHFKYDGGSLKELKRDIETLCLQHFNDKQEPTDQTIGKYIDQAIRDYPPLNKP